MPNPLFTQNRSVSFTITPLITALLIFLLGYEAFRVENGQFEREYSRVHAMVVLGIGVMLLMLLLGFLVVGIRALVGRGR